MCRIETSIYKCGHASVPIHEFCPRNPSRLLPNERGACIRGYERSVPLVSSICRACRQVLQRKGSFIEDDDQEHVVERVRHLDDARMLFNGHCKKENGDKDGEDRKVMLKERGVDGYVGEVVLPVAAKKVEIAWQQ